MAFTPLPVVIGLVQHGTVDYGFSALVNMVLSKNVISETGSPATRSARDWAENIPVVPGTWARMSRFGHCKKAWLSTFSELGAPQSATRLLTSMASVFGIKRSWSILPYNVVAVTAANLLNAGFSRQFSPSRFW